MLVATQLRGLVFAARLGIAEGAGLGVRTTVQLLTRALTLDLGFLVLGALALWAASGPKRNLGRAFDIACVAAVPLLIVELVATTIVLALDTQLPPAASWVLRGISWSWAGAILALGVRTARLASGAAISVPPPVEIAGRRGGLLIIGLAVAGLGTQIVWMAHYPHMIRPVTRGAVAPRIALPEIGPGGALGATFEVPPGQVAVVEFWATWCVPCKQALPKLDALVKRYPGSVGLAINLDDPVAARALFDERGYGMKLVADDGETSARYGVSEIPHILVIDGAGTVRFVSRGSTAEVEAAVVSALNAEQIRK